jgi:hypothetical protein
MTIQITGQSINAYTYSTEDESISDRASTTPTKMTNDLSQFTQTEIQAPIDSSVTITETAKQMQALHTSIMEMPEVRGKIANGSLDILQGGEQGFDSAERIAAKLLTLDSALPSEKTS